MNYFYKNDDTSISVFLSFYRSRNDFKISCLKKSTKKLRQNYSSYEENFSNKTYNEKRQNNIKKPFIIINKITNDTKLYICNRIFVFSLFSIINCKNKAYEIQWND